MACLKRRFRIFVNVVKIPCCETDAVPLLWIYDFSLPSRSNVDNLNNIRRDTSRHFRNKKKSYLRDKIEELETNSKMNKAWDLYRGINDFKKGY